MSIHAQITTEAQARLAAQKRNSTISSVIVSILVLVLLALSLYFIFLKPVLLTQSSVITYVNPDKVTEEPEITKVNTNTQRKPSAPSSTMTKVIASSAPSNVTIPIPDFDTPDPATDFGTGDDFGNGWNNGDGDGVGFAGIPSSMKKRCSSADRMSRLQSSGGTPECETAVVKGLDWLKATQEKDGSWTDDKVGMTGLALLAYLGHCETPLSEEYGDSVTAAIAYLVDIAMKNEGKMADDFQDKHWPYEHAIATYALSEANTFCQQLGIPFPNLRAAMEKAADWIVDSQHDSGGWDYLYDQSGKRGGDTSIVAWHVQALKAAKFSGWKHAKLKSVESKALGYIKSCQHASGGVGYTGPKEHPTGGFTLAGAGAVCYQMLEKSSDPVVRKACSYIEKEVNFDYNSTTGDLYQLYYNAQAMLNRGGVAWNTFNNTFRDGVLANQETDGSWKDVGGGQNVTRGIRQNGKSVMAKHYRTCLCLLTLEVYYRFLPGTGT